MNDLSRTTQFATACDQYGPSFLIELYKVPTIQSLDKDHFPQKSQFFSSTWLAIILEQALGKLSGLKS
jgi:hypothetical protein